MRLPIGSPESIRPPAPVVDRALRHLRQRESERWRHVYDPRLPWVQPWLAAVAFGSTRSLAPATGTGGTSASWALSGSNLVIVVHISLVDAAATVDAVSWSLGSGTTSQVASLRNSDNCLHAIWVIPAPTAGSGTYTVTLSASVPYQITADYFTGADPTTPCPTGDAVTAGSATEATPSTLTPTNLTANDASSGGAGSVSQNPTGVSPSQTYLDSTTAINAQAGYATGTTGVTFNYDATQSSSKVVVRIVAAAAIENPGIVSVSKSHGQRPAPYKPGGAR